MLITFHIEVVEIQDDEDEYETQLELYIYDIENYGVEKLLKDNNIPYEKSHNSESIYLNDGTIRISTHKRPDYEHGGVYYSHEYDLELIAKDEIEIYEIIEELIKSSTIK